MLSLLTGIILILLDRDRIAAWTAVLVGLALVMAVVIAWMNVAAARAIEKDRDAWLPPK